MLVGLLGVIIHLTFLASIFDIYFRTPLIHGMIPHATPLPAPAQRLVLFVADGLRADKFFELENGTESRAPFLRDIVVDKGAWGVSHTRVPTESRPGHVALIAGVYEDVSAVAKGWKENPVEFDSIFNQSRYTWGWGSPDILPMFAKGDAKNHLYFETYSSDNEDFAGADSSNLDTWVFDKFKDFLIEAKDNKTLETMLSQDKIVIFLHLLGLDTNGHAHKPNSEEYLKNIRLVDEGIQECVNYIEDYYGHDGKTSYIFTSDHGMTDWGSHGAGHPDETLTPLVVWGAGIREPLGAGREMYNDGLSEAWRLSQVRRVDVQQADIAPLMAALIGIPFPVNSVGVLPVEFLGTAWAHKAIALLTNTRQILSQYQLKMRLKEQSTLPVFFWTYRDLSPQRQAELMNMIETLMKQMRYRDAIQVGRRMMELALKGYDYYQKYDRFPLNCSIFLGFLGWMNYVILLIIKDYSPVMHVSLEDQESADGSLDYTSKVNILLIFGFISFVTVYLLYIQYAPMMYYLYFLMPVLLWTMVTFRWHLYHQAKVYLEYKDYFLQFTAVVIFGIFWLEILVLSFFKRELLSIGLVAFAVWPMFTSLKSSQKRLTAIWFVMCLIMAVFPLLPVVGRESNYSLVTLAGWLSILLISFAAKRPELGLTSNTSLVKKDLQAVFLTAFQVFLLCLTIYIVRSTSDSISNKTGLPVINQLISWIILASSFALPLFGPTALLNRLLNVSASLIAPYLLLSIAHEGLFCLGLCILLFLWLCLEHQLSDSNLTLQEISFDENSLNFLLKSVFAVPFKLHIEDIRRAYFFLYFIIFAFFGTGNIASINSYEPSSVYCFLTIFNPFVMGSLLLVKVIIPFLLVSCVFRALLVTVRVPTRALFLLVLLMSDFMGLHFFFMVKDTGSWLEIGTSISHYVIIMTTIIFVMVLYGAAWILTTWSLPCVTPKFKWHIQ